MASTSSATVSIYLINNHCLFLYQLACGNHCAGVAHLHEIHAFGKALQFDGLLAFGGGQAFHLLAVDVEHTDFVGINTVELDKDFVAGGVGIVPSGWMYHV